MAKVASCLDKSKFVPYWLSWANGNIRLGSGSIVGENIILEYTDPAPIPVNWLSLYGWSDIPGSFIIQKGVNVEFLLNYYNCMFSFKL